MCEFILGVTKKDGSEYEPTTIRSFISSIDRHLRTKNSKMSIFNDIDFAKIRAVLKRKRQQLKSLGLGNKPKATENFTKDHIKTMLEAGTLGDKTPKALIHSMWLICTSYFDMRTGKECHDLCWGDIQLGVDEVSGEEYIMYGKERQTKTRSGSNPRDTRSKKRLFQTLQDQGVPANQIIQISGHKNVNNLNTYSRINSNQEYDISSILSSKNTDSRQPPVNQRQQSPSEPAPVGSGFPRGFFPNCSFHGPVTLNFSSTVSETLSHTPTFNLNGHVSTKRSSPESSHLLRTFKRIRTISESD